MKAITSLSFHSNSGFGHWFNIVEMGVTRSHSGDIYTIQPTQLEAGVNGGGGGGRVSSSSCQPFLEEHSGKWKGEISRLKLYQAVRLGLWRACYRSVCMCVTVGFPSHNERNHSGCRLSPKHYVTLQPPIPPLSFYCTWLS